MWSLLLFQAALFIGGIFLHHELRITYRKNERYIFGLTRDFTALQDFALAQNGGYIITSLTTSHFELSSEITWTATNAISSDLTPGRCWRIPFSLGQLGVGFSYQVNISHITVDHVPQQLVLRTQDSPKTMRIWGIRNRNPHGMVISALDYSQHSCSYGCAPPIKSKLYLYYPILNITYDITNTDDHIQTFDVPNSKRNPAFEGVVIEILDNWGDISTCLYRVRAHGTSYAEIKE